MKLELIINEKKYVEDIVSSNQLPEQVTVNMMITYLTKYYYNDNITLKELCTLVCNQMNKFELDVTQYQEYLAVDRIQKLFNALQKKTINLLRDNDYIPIYKSEYNNILTCKTDKEQKLLFTLYVLARYTNKYGWVYNNETDIYKLANTTKNKTDDIIYKLIQSEKLRVTKKVDDLKLGVVLSTGNEEIEMKIHTLKHLGNQYVCHKKPDYIMCESCGKLVKKKNTGRPSKYCDKCAYDIKLEQNQGYYYEKTNF